MFLYNKKEDNIKGKLVITHRMLIKPLVMYNVHYFWNNLKNNLRTLSGRFLTKHNIDKDRNQCSYVRMFTALRWQLSKVIESNACCE